MTRRRNRSWRQRQERDAYVRDARASGYRSRAAYKLLEIDAKDKLLQRARVVVDLGAAPGGWSQVAAERVGAGGRVIALDRLAIEPLKGVEFLLGDIDEAATLVALSDTLAEARAGLVMADMAPNITGVRSVDQARAVALNESALAVACDFLEPGGDFLVKIFQGEGHDTFIASVRGRFARVSVRKPQASRAESRETYLVAKEYAI